jgi:hypothetical protein
MKQKKIKKIILFFICILFFLSLFPFLVQAKELEIDYPDLIGSAPPPTSTKSLLPNYIKYIFSLILKISAIIAFLALVYGGFSYITSTGNPAQLDEAKDQILSAFLGLIILLSSYLLLNTINPELVTLKNPRIDPTGLGIVVYDVENCGEGVSTYNSKHIFKTVALEGGNPSDPDSLSYWRSNIKSVKFLQSPVDVTITFFLTNNTEVSPSFKKGDCLDATEDLNITADVEKIRFYYHLPGVYLYKEYTTNDCKGDFLFFNYSTATLPKTPENWNDQIHCIRIVNPHYGEGTRYMVVLHENENFSGKCKEFVGINDEYTEVIGGIAVTYPGETIYKGSELGDLDGQASSLSIFKLSRDLRTDDGSNEGVFFYDNTNYQTPLIAIRGKKPESENFPAYAYYSSQIASSGIFFGETYESTNGSTTVENIVKIPNLQDVKTKEGDANDKITSLKVTPGKYLTILWENGQPKNPQFSGKCEIFTDDVSNLRSYDLGQCACPISCDCASSLKVYQIK